MPKNLATNKYQAFLDDMEALYRGVKNAVTEAGWKMGKRIIEIEQEGEIRAVYGTQLIPKMSKDLTARLGGGFSATNLKDMRRFFLAYPKGRPVVQLSLSHHVRLLAIKDPKKRRELERRALKENISRDDISTLIHQENVAEAVVKANADPDKPVPQLKFTRGKLWTVGLVPATKSLARPAGTTTIDLGFRQWHYATGDERKDVAVTDKPEYTYAALVERVVDGDTLWVQIDLGFENTTRQKMRLRGIDCPELDTSELSLSTFRRSWGASSSSKFASRKLETSEGKKAKDFVMKRLPVGSAIVVQTHKDSTDKYDRYLADVFYLIGETDVEKIAAQGTYLNQELLDERLAIIM